MFKKDISEVVPYFVEKAKEFGGGCERVFVAVSGGVDSALIVTLLCEAYGPKNVVGLYRDIRSDPKHLKDATDLAQAVGFCLIKLDMNPAYDLIVNMLKEQFITNKLDWFDEESEGARESGFENAYACLKSRLTTPVAGFISKAIDSGKGRIFGTGNMEEDGLLRYFDKYGDGAVDNNILNGLTKMEVRQMLMFFGKKYRSEIFRRIAEKKPSADLKGVGDDHNDESELTSWAINMGYGVEVSYGDLEKEGNIAWACKEDLDFGVITENRELPRKRHHTLAEGQVIGFCREIEKMTRHKVEPIPGFPRKKLRELGLVD